MLIESPGGNGAAAEKLARMSRNFANGFRVFVLDSAKSAATLIALAADEIVMGYCSEIGPIDAQVPLFFGGTFNLVSAQTIIDTEDSLRSQYLERIEENKETQDILTSLASLDPAMVEHCRCLMRFSKVTAKEFLKKHMLKDKFSSKRELGIAVKQIVDNLSLPKQHQVHSRVIQADDAKELGLNTVSLAKDDSLWKNMWQYHDRALVYMDTTRHSKLVETPTITLAAGRMVSQKGDKEND